MTSPPDDSPYDLLARQADRGRPVVTHYDGPDSRVELSVASLTNAVAKAGGLLRDTVGMGPGSTLSVDLPRHWQLPVWVLAGMSIGATVGRDLPEHVDARIVGPRDLTGPAGVSEAASREPARRADEVLACSCDAFGLPVPGGVPAGVLDVGLEVRGHPDVLQRDAAAASRGSLLLAGTALPWAQAADRVMAAHPTAGPGARLWVDDGTPESDVLPLSCVLPLAVTGSVVLASALSAEQAARIRQAEAVSWP